MSPTSNTTGNYGSSQQSQTPPKRPVFLGMKLEGSIENWLFSGTVVLMYHNPKEGKVMEAMMPMHAPPEAIVSELSCELGSGKISHAQYHDSHLDSGVHELTSRDSGGMMQTSQFRPDASRDTHKIYIRELKPGRSATLKMDFTLELAEVDGKYRLVIPTPVFKHGDDFIGANNYPKPKLEFEIRLQHDDKAWIISSPNLEIYTKYVEGEDNEQNLVISTNTDSFSSGEFILEIDTSEGSIIPPISYCEVGDECYFRIRHQVEAYNERKSNSLVKILVDSSGSMLGEKNESGLAKKFLDEYLNHFEEQDFFTLSAFGSKVKHSADSYRNFVKGERISLPTISELGGGTNFSMALNSLNHLKAMQQPSPDGSTGNENFHGYENKTENILIISDGSVSNYNSDFMNIINSYHYSNNCNRYFVVLVGSSAKFHLTELAKASNGAVFEILSPTDIIEVAKDVYESVREEKATNVNVEWPDQPNWKFTKYHSSHQLIHSYSVYDKPRPEGNVTIEYELCGEKLSLEFVLTGAVWSSKLALHIDGIRETGSTGNVEDGNDGKQGSSIKSSSKHSYFLYVGNEFIESGIDTADLLSALLLREANENIDILARAMDEIFIKIKSMNGLFGCIDSDFERSNSNSLINILNKPFFYEYMQVVNSYMYLAHFLKIVNPESLSVSSLNRLEIHDRSGVQKKFKRFANKLRSANSPVAKDHLMELILLMKSNMRDLDGLCWMMTMLYKYLPELASIPLELFFYDLFVLGFKFEICDLAKNLPRHYDMGRNQESEQENLKSRIEEALADFKTPDSNVSFADIHFIAGKLGINSSITLTDRKRHINL